MPSSPLAQELRLLTRDHQCLVWQRTRLVNQITACLKDYYPGAVNFFSFLDQPWALAFLLAFPTPESDRQLSLEQLRDFCFRHFYRDPRTINVLYKKIQTPTPSAYPWAVRARSRYLLALLGQLASLQANITAYEREVDTLFRQHEDHGIFQSLPGAGPILGARLLAEIGDCRGNFPTAASLQASADTAPVTKRSGQYLSVDRVPNDCGMLSSSLPNRVFSATSGQGNTITDNDNGVVPSLALSALWPTAGLLSCGQCGKRAPHMTKLITKPIRLVISPNLDHNLLYQVLDVDSPGRRCPAPLLRGICRGESCTRPAGAQGCPHLKDCDTCGIPLYLC